MHFIAVDLSIYSGIFVGWLVGFVFLFFWLNVWDGMHFDGRIAC